MKLVRVQPRCRIGHNSGYDRCVEETQADSCRFLLCQLMEKPATPDMRISVPTVRLH